MSLHDDEHGCLTSGTDNDFCAVCWQVGCKLKRQLVDASELHLTDEMTIRQLKRQLRDSEAARVKAEDASVALHESAADLVARCRGAAQTALGEPNSLLPLGIIHALMYKLKQAEADLATAREHDERIRQRTIENEVLRQRDEQRLRPGGGTLGV